MRVHRPPLMQDDAGPFWLEYSCWNVQSAPQAIEPKHGGGAMSVMARTECAKDGATEGELGCEGPRRPVPYSRLPSPQKSSRLVADVAGNSRHVAGKSRACSGLLRCFSHHSGPRRSFLRLRKRMMGGCLSIYVRRSGGDVHNAPGGCRTAEICRLFD